MYLLNYLSRPRLLAIELQSIHDSCSQHCVFRLQKRRHDTVSQRAFNRWRHTRHSSAVAHWTTNRLGWTEGRLVAGISALTAAANNRHYTLSRS